MTFASKCIGYANKWGGAIGGIIKTTRLTASIAIDDVMKNGFGMGGIIGLVNDNSVAVIENCIGKVVLPPSGLYNGFIAGELYSGTVND